MPNYYYLYFNVQRTEKFSNVLRFYATRPKPPYGRHGLAGSLDTGYSQAGTFLGVLNVLLHTYSAQLGGTQLTFMTEHEKVIIFRPKQSFLVIHRASAGISLSFFSTLTSKIEVNNQGLVTSALYLYLPFVTEVASMHS